MLGSRAARCQLFSFMTISSSRSAMLPVAVECSMAKIFIKRRITGEYTKRKFEFCLILGVLWLIQKFVVGIQ